MKPVAPLLLYGILVAAFASCTGRVTSSEVTGRWALEDRNEVLELKDDTTFTHALASEGRSALASGEWKLIGGERAPRILLKYQHDFDSRRSTASLNVVRGWTGKLELAADAERRISFEKQP